MRLPLLCILIPGLAAAQPMNCNFRDYKAADGLKAEMRAGALELTWQGERGETLRATLGVNGGQPVVRELAVEKNGKWSVLGSNLTPEFRITSGQRRISAQQEVPLRQLGMFTPEVIERQKWFAFWDARSTCRVSQDRMPRSDCRANRRKFRNPGRSSTSPAAR